jgi:hypothetical protein
MTLEESSRIESLSSSSSEGTSSVGPHTDYQEASVIVEGVKSPDLLPFLLRTRGVLAATLKALGGGRFEVSAPNTTRETLRLVFKSLPGLQLAEAK